MIIEDAPPCLDGRQQVGVTVHEHPVHVAHDEAVHSLPQPELQDAFELFLQLQQMLSCCTLDPRK